MSPPCGHLPASFRHASPADLAILRDGFAQWLREEYDNDNDSMRRLVDILATSIDGSPEDNHAWDQVLPLIQEMTAGTTEILLFAFRNELNWQPLRCAIILDEFEANGLDELAAFLDSVMIAPHRKKGLHLLTEKYAAHLPEQERVALIGGLAPLLRDYGYTGATLRAILPAPEDSTA